MDVYLKNEKEKVTFHFPINPIDNIQINRNKKFNTVDIVDKGEFDIPDKGKKIKELSFNTLLPKSYDIYCKYNELANPTESITKLEKWMEQLDPLRLIITDFNFNDLVIISSLGEEERAGELGDKYINLSFRVWRELRIETLQPAKRSISKKTIPLKKNRSNTKSNSKVYIVKPGDSLWKISKWWYGTSSKWNVIYKNNKKTIGSNPNRIFPGQKIIFP